jgi:hypothetical protein
MLVTGWKKSAMRKVHMLMTSLAYSALGGTIIYSITLGRIVTCLELLGIVMVVDKYMIILQIHHRGIGLLCKRRKQKERFILESLVSGVVRNVM